MEKDYYTRSSAASNSRNRSSVSRTTASFTDRVSFSDAQSVPTVDQLSTARASVSMSDKLWTQIDVLDDVRVMADEVKRSGTFFNDEFTARLSELKDTQSALMEKVLRHQQESDRAREIRKSDAKQNSGVLRNDEDLELEQNQTRARMMEFFASTSKEPVDSAQMKNFNNLQEYVSEVRHSLDEVGDKMQAFDAAKKKLW